MDMSISVADGARTAALVKALAAYNASHFNSPLTAEQFVQKMVDQQVDTLVKAYVVTTVSKLVFLDRFTVSERVAIREAGKTNPQINDYLELLNAAQEVSLTSERTTSGVQTLEALGLIAAGRGSEILAL